MGRRAVYQPSGERADYQLYDRADFKAGYRIMGPAVINEHTATTVLHEGDTAVVGPYGEIVIAVGKGENSA